MSEFYCHLSVMLCRFGLECVKCVLWCECALCSVHVHRLMWIGVDYILWLNVRKSKWRFTVQVKLISNNDNLSIVYGMRSSENHSNFNGKSYISRITLVEPTGMIKLKEWKIYNFFHFSWLVVSYTGTLWFSLELEMIFNWTDIKISTNLTR